LIPIDTSKETDIYIDFKYVSFIKFSLTHQKLSASENLPNFEKRGETPRKNHKILMKITPPDSTSRGFELLRGKMWNFVFFVRRNIPDACLFVFFSFQG